MKNDYEPILIETPKPFNEIEVYAIHDLHMGNELFDNGAWERMKTEILEQPNRYMVFVGDAMENAVVGSKGDVYSQTVPPHLQQEWFTEQLIELKDRVLAIVDGNHERNRSTKNCDLYPLYTSAAIAGMQDKYRPHFAVCDIGVGCRDKDKKQQVHYVLYLVHRAKTGRGANTALATSGIDVVICGHDHEPKDFPRAQLHYNPINKNITTRSIEVVDAGSWLNYGGYSVDGGYLPNSSKKYKLVLHGGEKKIETVGFYI